jgi:hypothetical protein
VISSITSPEPAHPATCTLLSRVHSSCPPHLAGDVQSTGDRVALSWRVVHAIRSARNLDLGALVSELHDYGRVLADDRGLTIIARSS